MKKIITIDGAEYQLNVTAAISSGALKPLIRRPGQIYRAKDGELFILTSVACGSRSGSVCMAMVQLSDGNRYVDAVEVKTCLQITKDEWTRITGNEPSRFDLVGETITEVFSEKK